MLLLRYVKYRKRDDSVSLIFMLAPCKIGSYFFCSPFTIPPPSYHHLFIDFNCFRAASCETPQYCITSNTDMLRII